MGEKISAILFLIFCLQIVASEDVIGGNNSSATDEEDPQSPGQAVRCVINNMIDSVFEVTSYTAHWGSWTKEPSNIQPYTEDDYKSHGSLFGGLETDVIFKFKDYEQYGTFKIHISLGHWEVNFSYDLTYSESFGKFFKIEVDVDRLIHRKIYISIDTHFPNNYNLFISGDPQPYRTFSGNDPNQDFALWESENKAHVEKIIEINRAKNYLFGIINGDVTESGRKAQRDSFENIYVSKIPFKLYLGLGNRDYQNNINDCWDIGQPNANGCAAGSVEYMKKKLEEYASSNLTDYNYDFNDQYSGSMAYKFDYGNYSFFQLQNYPSYQVNFTAEKTYNINTSFKYLEEQLAKTNKNRVLCVHDMQRYLTNQDPDTKKFKDIVDKYNVKLIFAGHTHQYGKESFGAATVFTNYALFDGGYFTATIKFKCIDVHKHDGELYGTACYK